MTNIQFVGMTVAQMEQSIEFYTQVLSCQKIADMEVSGEDWEKLQNLFGLRMRIVQMQLGEEIICLMEYSTPQGRPIPFDSRSNDRLFQHLAVVVRDIEQAYQHLRRYRVQHTSNCPQQLPDWNEKLGGVKAFYFKDPDGHNLELIEFPPDKIEPKWQQTEGMFLGIDHTAIVVADAEASLPLYRDCLGLKLALQAENYGTEYEHISGLFGSRVQVNSLESDSGMGFELLEYIAPTNGRPMPSDSRANDIWHYQTTIAVKDLDAIASQLPQQPCRIISPGIVEISAAELGFKRGLAIADLDGHVLHLVEA